MAELQAELNRLAGTTNLDAQGAANALAGTSQLDLVGALNKAAGTTNLELNGAVKAVATKYGGNSSLDSNDALDTASGLLSEAVAWWKANQYSGTGALLNQKNTSLHNAQLGSTTGADTNDPTWLPYADEKYAYLPGIAGNYLSSPDSPAVSITGDIDLRARVALDDWTPAATMGIIARATADPNRSYRFSVSTTGGLSLEWWPTGSAASGVAQSSSVTIGAVDGSTLWVRATLDVDNGSGQYAVMFFTSSDGTTWTQLGTTRVGATGVTSIADGTAPLEIGSLGFAGGTGMLTGKVYRAQIRNGINGTVVFDASLSSATEPYASFTESSSNAATVTINRTASGKKTAVVDRSMFLLGTDDYMQVADHNELDFAAADSFTVVAAIRRYGLPAATQMIFGKRDTALSVNVGWNFSVTTAGAPQLEITDGTLAVTDAGAAMSSGVLHTVAGRRSVSADTVEAFLDGASTAATTDTTAASLANAMPLRFGSTSQAVGSVLEGEFIAAAIFRRALTASEISRLSTELLS